MTYCEILRIRLQWCQEITVHECAKIASTKTAEVDWNIKCPYQILAYIYWIFQPATYQNIVLYCLIRLDVNSQEHKNTPSILI